MNIYLHTITETPANRFMNVEAKYNPQLLPANIPWIVKNSAVTLLNKMTLWK